MTFSPLSLHGISKFKKKKKHFKQDYLLHPNRQWYRIQQYQNFNLFFCRDNSIIHRFSRPLQPPAEWKNRKIQWNFHFSLQKNLLSDSQLSHQFSEYAVNTANNIHNRITHRWDINNKIPFEIITNSKEDDSRFKVFGCRVFFYIPKSFLGASLITILHLGIFFSWL